MKQHKTEWTPTLDARLRELRKEGNSFEAIKVQLQTEFGVSPTTVAVIRRWAVVKKS